MNGRVEGFLVIADLETHDQQKTILHALRVLNSRLKDAIFFYKNDLVGKRDGMRAWNDKLKSVRFHEKLGSQYDEKRIVKVQFLARRVEQDEVTKPQHLSRLPCF